MELSLTTPDLVAALDEASDERLVEEVLAGDAAAWTELVRRVHPAVVAQCRGAWPGLVFDDHPADVARLVVERLHAADFRRLRAFQAARARHPDGSFARWLRVVVRATAIDVLRSRPELQRSRERSTRGVRQLLFEQYDDDRQADPRDATRRVEIRRILARLHDRGFPARYREALSLWLAGCDDQDVGRYLGVSAGEARKILHAARQRLRRAVKKGAL